MNGSLVSIITPCYNAERYLGKLLDSVLAQDYESIEFIIIDDGSTDRSLDILNSYVDAFRERGISYIILSQPNQGAASAINRGLELFSGDYITFIDADDFFSETSISERVSFLEHNKEDYDAVYSKTDLVNANNYRLIVGTLQGRSGNLFLSMIRENGYIWTHAYMIRSSYFLAKHPKRNIAEFKAGQNIQIFLPLWYKGRVGYIDKSLITIVEHSDSHSRLVRSDDENRRREREIEAIYIDTLRDINMPDDERNEYISIINERYKDRTRRVFRKIASDKDELGRLYDYDEQRFRNNYASDVSSASQTQLAAKLVFSTHSLEKSLSNDNFEIGHGFHVAYLLTGMLNMYVTKGYDKNHLAYINTLSTLKVFYNLHKDTEYVDKIESIFGDMLPIIEGCTSLIGGTDSILLEQKKDNSNKNFKDLAEGRYAVRSYANKPVEKKDIEEVVSIATKTPTVCNRQGIRVYSMYESHVIEKVLKIQGGIEYYDTPPALLLITADDSCYVGANERNQGFVDGGLFAMSILYSLEYKGLAACPLHAMLDEAGEIAIRGMLDIPDSERFITFISAGHFSENNRVCKSFRYPVEYILSEKSKIYDYSIESTSANEDILKDAKSSVGLRKKLRIRTRTINTLRSIKHKTRIRTRIRDLKENVAKKRMRRLEVGVYDGAIVTLPGNYNYGNLIQKYALQTFLLRHNLNFRIIDMIRTNEDGNPRIYGRLQDFFDNVLDTLPLEQAKGLRYVNYIVGSDQVWRNWYDWAQHLLYNNFLDFVKDKEANTVSYAASFGVDSLEDAGYSQEVIKVARPLLNNFNAISVREDSAVKLVKELSGNDDKKVELVLDPTLLLKAEDYSELIDKSSVKNEQIPKLQGYVLDDQGEKGMLIKKIAKEYRGDYRVITPNEDVPHDSVELWLKGFRDAEFIITDSFHGTVFSIINNKPFIVFANKKRGLSRMESLLKTLGIAEDRMLFEEDIKSFDITKLKEIDWQGVNSRLDELRKNSGNWLLSNIVGKER